MLSTRHGNANAMSAWTGSQQPMHAPSKRLSLPAVWKAVSQRGSLGQTKYWRRQYGNERRAADDPDEESLKAGARTAAFHKIDETAKVFR